MKEKEEVNGLLLSDYIVKVCNEILTGVVKAQSGTDFGKYIGCTPVSGEYKDEAGNIISYVEFSVAAEVSNSMVGEAGIKVPHIGGLDGKVDNSRTDLNRVEFSIPIVIPSPAQQIELRENIERERKQKQNVSRKSPPRIKKPMARGY